MNTRRHPYFDTAFACLVTASTVIMGAPFLAAELSDAGPDESEDGDDDADVPIVPGSEGDAERTEIVVNLDPAKTSHGTDRESTVDALQAHADWTQRHVIEWADERDAVVVKNRFWLANAVLLEVESDDVDLDTVPGDHVRSIHPNFDVDLSATPAPEPNASDDPAGSDDADDGEPPKTSGSARSGVTYGLDRLGAPAVWEDYETRGGGVDVAVLDTGVDPDHPDIEIDPDNWAHFDRSGDRKGTSPQDGNGHGTHTSGTVVGSSDPDGDVPAFGVAPDATLYHGKVLTDRGGGNYARIVAGMEWAVEEDVDVISMSLGVRGTAPELIEPSENARDAGILVVASAGNSGDGTSGSPGNIPVTLAVGASDEDDEIARFSSGEEIDTERAWGSDAPEHWPDEYVVPDVAAPGVDVLSATPGGGYDEKSGTSMAAPHVAGAAALVLAASDADREGVEAALEAAAEKPDDWDAPDDERDTRYGLGVIDAHAAVEHAVEEHGVSVGGSFAPTATASVESDPWLTDPGATASLDRIDPFDGEPESHRRRFDGEDTGTVGAAV